MNSRLSFLISAILILGLLAAGCSPADDSAETILGISVKPSPLSPSVPTLIQTTPPDIEATTAPTAEPANNTETDATPSSGKDSGKKEIADGFYYMALSDDLKKRITGMSYPKDDDDTQISYDDLNYIKLCYYDFEAEVHDGELIVNKKLAKEVTEIFYELYKAEYPLESVRLVDDFGEPGDDNLSMAANNTSAFNYRKVTGSKKLSRHSYGAAIDINPVLNPYIDGDRVAPENGAEYVDRSLDLIGMIDHDDLCYKLFTQRGWTWGGDWSGDKDYQHFSKDIGF